VVQTNFVILQFCCFSIAFLLLALCWFAFRKKRWLLQFSTDDTCLQICLELNFFVLTVQSLKMFLFCCSRLLCITWLSVKLMANTLIWKPDSRLSRHSKSIEIWFCIMRMCRQQEVSFEEWIEVKYSVCWHHWHVKVFATPGSMLPLITWIVGTAIASISFALLTAHILIRFKATNVCLLVTPGHVKLAGLVCRFFGGGDPGSPAPITVQTWLVDGTWSRLGKYKWLVSTWCRYNWQLGRIKYYKYKLAKMLCNKLCASMLSLIFSVFSRSYIDSGDLNQVPPKQSVVCSTCIILALPVNCQFIWMACAFGMSATQPILGWL